MNKITFGLFSIFTLLFLTACEGVREDAEGTPIGSVVSGKSRDTEDYVERVRERNKAEDRDVWRPASTDLDGIR